MNQHIINGTTYDPKTPTRVIQVLEAAREFDTRVRIWYGDTSTGKAWDEEHDVTGRIGRSTGSSKVPLLLTNARSTGGGALLDHCIVRIDNIAARVTIYQHPSFDLGTWEVVHEDNKMDLRPWKVCKDGDAHAGFSTEAKARRFMDFMTGKRYGK